MRLFIAALFATACIAHVHAAQYHTEQLRASGAALIEALHSSRDQLASSSVQLPQQQIQNPRHSGVVPAEEGAMLQALAHGLPHAVADSKPGGRSGPPDETTVFLNMLPVVIPCIFLVAILIVVIALRYFNAIAEQTPEGERVLPLRSLHG